MATVQSSLLTILAVGQVLSGHGPCPSPTSPYSYKASICIEAESAKIQGLGLIVPLTIPFIVPFLPTFVQVTDLQTDYINLL